MHGIPPKLTAGLEWKASVKRITANRKGLYNVTYSSGIRDIFRAVAIKNIAPSEQLSRAPYNAEKWNMV